MRTFYCDRCGKELDGRDLEMRNIRYGLIGARWLLCWECDCALTKWMREGKEKERRE